MGFSLSDAFDFEKFALGDIWDRIKDNPEQLLLGAATPVGAELWGGLLGKDFEPFVNEFGGPTDSTIQNAQASGVDTGSAQGLHNVAEGVASIYAGNYFGNQLGGFDPTGLLGGGQQPVDNTAHMQALELERRKRQSARGLL